MPDRVSSMDADEVRNQLSLFTGLDDATIDEQIVPMLQGIKSRADLQDQLTGLIGNEFAQASFIRAYAESRFPPTRGTPRPSKLVQGRPSQPQQPIAQRAEAARPMASTSTAISQYVAPSIDLALASAQVTRGPKAVTQNRGGPLESKAPNGISGESKAALLVIERRLRYSKGKGKAKACFCGAALHPVSPIHPMCDKCFLIICDLNVPYNSPCPSCKHSPLAPQQVVDDYARTQEIERDILIRTEIERIRFESDEEERARRAIQFPTLEGATQFGSTQPTAVSGYANKAGGVDHYKQIDQAYKSAQAREAADAARGERRVLTLDPKTKKAKVITTITKKKAAVQSVKKLSTNVDELDDPREPFIDYLDHGYRKGKAADVEEPLGWPPRTSQFEFVPASLAGDKAGEADEAAEEKVK